ncbi:MAG: hypothetical protein HY737_00120 [Candidatus Omnitrophica bacterium]|nr:hypothetical protein [Candidatus Omnitrophota bacterium]
MRQRWLTITLLLATTAYCIAEEITLPTYYPSPRGVYQELRSTGNTILAFPAGNVGIGMASQPDSTITLEVQGGPIKATDGMIIATPPANPATSSNGQLWLIRNLLVPAAPVVDIDSGLRIRQGNNKTVSIAAESGAPTSPLRLTRTGTNLGIVLVPLNDPRASKARIMTASGVRALKRRFNFFGQLFGIGSGGAVVRRMPDGTVGKVGNIPGEGDFGLGYDSDNDLLYAVDGNYVGADGENFGPPLERFDPQTGTSVTVGRLHYADGTPVWVSDPGMAYDPNTGTMYLASAADGFYPRVTLFRVDTTTAVATRVADIPAGGNSNTGLAFDPFTNTMYAMVCSSGLYKIDPATWTSTFLMAPPSASATGLAYNYEKGLLYVSDSGAGLTKTTMQPVINPETGQPVVNPETGEVLLEPGPSSTSTLYTLDPKTGETTLVFPSGGIGGAESEGLDFR